MNRIIFLYGPPGSGKTTTGNVLANTLHVPFIDLDAEIEEKARMPISQIFESDGEEGFRKKESLAEQAIVQQ